MNVTRIRRHDGRFAVLPTLDWTNANKQEIARGNELLMFFFFFPRFIHSSLIRVIRPSSDRSCRIISMAFCYHFPIHASPKRSFLKSLAWRRCCISQNQRIEMAKRVSAAVETIASVMDMKNVTIPHFWRRY